MEGLAGTREPGTKGNEMRINLMAEHAREILKAPEGWDVYRWEAIGGDRDSPPKLLRVDGVVAPAKTRGKHKGFPNWKAADKTTERTAYFTPDEHVEWCKQWDLRTGKCAECVGTGEVFQSWHFERGTTYKPCARCGGSKVPANV